MQSVARYARRRRAVVPRSGATKTRWHVLRARATLWREGLAGLATDLENAVYFGVAHINAAGMAIIAAIPFAIGSPPVALAATREEVSRCRAVRNNIERRDCFEALKEGSKAKADEAAKAKKGNAPSPPRRMPLQRPPLLIILASHLVSPFVSIATHSPPCLLLACLLPVQRKRPRTVAKPFLKAPKWSC